MSINQKIRSGMRVMNFVSSEGLWRALSAEADFKVEEKLPLGKKLIIAPHPDDEVFGCFSALKNSTVAYIFAGNSSSASREKRAEEAKEAAKVGKFEPVFFDLPDNSEITKGVISALCEIIIKENISSILLPSMTDPNIDHRNSTLAVIEALKIAKIKGLNLSKTKIYLYEIWNPLSYFNRLVKIDWQDKKRLMEKYSSQQKDRDYISAIKSLNDYRGSMYGLSAPAEAFFALPADLLLKIRL